ncbi:MAG: hypothetical protein M3O50_11625 [Myxococcota bacterium]|nr:hypothetical protein [Myxococcota bacterium]
MSVEEVWVDKARNDLSAAVPKFCLALEEHRRTAEGRVRTSEEMLATYFSYDDQVSADHVFRYMPPEVRGPIIAAWGIRGTKAALRDGDEKVQSVVHDALVAGDVDASAFEEGLTPETLVRWVPLADLWAFWRGGRLTKQAIHKALATAYELYLFDARWFLDALTARGGTIKGTDVLADGLTKEDLSQWIRRIHETGDGTPKGLVAALGWEKIVNKTADDLLVGVLDAIVAKVGLVTGSAPRESSSRLSDSAARSELKLELPLSSPALIAPPGTESSTMAVDAVLSQNGPTEGATIEGAAGNRTVEETANATDKPPPDDAGWAAPAAAVSSSGDEVAVVVDDEVVLSDSPPTPPRTRSVPPSIPEEGYSLPKHAPRLRFEGPLKPGGSHSKR